MHMQYASLKRIRRIRECNLRPGRKHLLGVKSSIGETYEP
ncbi:hypothetical protein HD596_011226 [Nonomuraea jabiensis]|uniref:Uncharacterized protein n=1 Tax=Nonomuraea jabiensis TaxID=882448 RepID=A0A7W9GIK6_9ACTN|nr:hypothetical protein [Nonomuraea jabiensis]